MLLCNMLGNTFYVSSDQLLAEAEVLHDQMLAKDPLFAAKALVFARNEGFMRLQPTFGLAKLAYVDKELFSTIFDRVILTPADLQDFMTILGALGHGQGGRVVKRAVAIWLENISQYWAIKYSGRSKGRGYSLEDILNTVHPVPGSEEVAALFRYIKTSEYDPDLLPQVATYEDYKRAESPEERARLIQLGRLPHEVVTGAAGTSLTAAEWAALVPQLPVFALLRHLKTLAAHGVLNESRTHIEKTLTGANLKRAKVLPLQIARAYLTLKDIDIIPSWVLDLLMKAVDDTFDQLPDIPGSTAVLLDRSYSMVGAPVITGAVFALALLKKAPNSLFWLFDTEVVPGILTTEPILQQALKIRADGGTDTGRPIHRLTRFGIKVDNIILITDEQQNVGSPFYKNLLTYRRVVNPNVKTFVIDVMPYNSAVVPPEDPLTWFIFGLNDTVLGFVSKAATGFGSMVSTIQAASL